MAEQWYAAPLTGGVGERSGAPAASGKTLSAGISVPAPGGEAPLQTIQIPFWGWLVMGVVLGAAITGLVMSLLRGRRGHAVQEPEPVPEVSKEPAGIRIEKLHEQGARSSQQDCFSVSQEEMIPNCGLLAVVADGMGGLSDGDKVSQTAVSTVMNHFYTAKGEPQQVLLSLLGLANQAVNDLLGEDGLNRSGSTMIMGLLREGVFHYLSVGDSRICLYRDGALYQLNREHIYSNDLYLRAVNGEQSVLQVPSQPGGGGLVSFLGMGQLRYVDIPAQPVAVCPGDMFLLMSDGVYNALPGGELAQVLSRGGEDVAGALRAAIRAKGYLNQDNYTAVILKC